jgi:hypothetical protein
MGRSATPSYGFGNRCGSATRSALENFRGAKGDFCAGVCDASGSDGVLRIDVPMGKEEADQDLQVTIEPAKVGPSPMCQEAWRQFVMETVGSVTEPIFVGHEQGEYEQREGLP